MQIVENSQKGPDPFSGGIWVFAEQQEGTLKAVTLELLGIAKKLASTLGVRVYSILIGENTKHILPTLFEYGSDGIFQIDQPVFHFYRAETYGKACKYLIEKYKPEILLIGATVTGRDLAGVLATSLNTGLTADCTALDIDMEKRILLASRPAFGGNIMATIACPNHRPQMATVRPRVMQMAEPEPGKTGTVIQEAYDIPEDSLKTKVLKIVRETSENIKLEDAKIIVAGGRGVPDFKPLYELAAALGGVVAGSRAVVEKGLIDYNHQVGQTGQTVRPKIYFAIGISGAIQHIVGMQGSDIIIAINTDPDCAMMKLATYGIPGDYNVVLKELIPEFKRALA
ncbi:MAG TPA: electron transfer flavoprotein subunit alpha/FixB family protein [Caproiciproducens sp.]|nr:electron transfer flavoprotein subunit alpha/FixB family protein [Caproiciproducens sp.]